MNKEVNENWINTYIKNNPFGFKETIIHRCRQMDKADVYEWVANNEVKIILLQQKVNQLESTLNEIIDWKDKNGNRYIYQDSLGEDWCFYDLDVFDELGEILNKVGG